MLTLALAQTPGIGGKTITRILTRNDLLGRSTDEFLRLSAEALREEYRMGAKSAEEWQSSRHRRMDEAQETAKTWDGQGVRLVTLADAAYPRQIEQMDPDPPGVLFLYGSLRLIESRTFCVLSSRKTSELGLLQIEETAEEGALAGEVLVSGHDTPEYQRAAVVPLRWGAPRILVLDQGMYAVLGPDLKEEPFRTARLWRFQFDPSTDLVVSTVAPDRPYHRNSNRIRDRLVGSLSRRLDFVQISQGGTMEKVAQLAVKAGRAVRVSELTPFADQMAASGARVMPPPSR